MKSRCILFRVPKGLEKMPLIVTSLELSNVIVKDKDMVRSMTRERLAKELEKTRERIAELQEKERQLAEAKEKADMEASKAIVEKKKIDPEVLQALCAMKEHEIKEILERRKKQDEESKKNII